MKLRPAGPKSKHCLVECSKRQSPVPDTVYHLRLSALILGPADGLTPSTRKGSDYAERAAAPASPAR